MHNCADILKTMSRNLNYLQNTPDAKITNAEFIYNQYNVETVKNFKNKPVHRVIFRSVL